MTTQSFLRRVIGSPVPVDYFDWMRGKTTEEQNASFRHMRVCALLGKAQRRYPYSDRTKRLSAEVESYYRGLSGNSK